MLAVARNVSESTAWQEAAGAIRELRARRSSRVLSSRWKIARHVLSESGYQALKASDEAAGEERLANVEELLTVARI
jgi:hypothetical protein